MLNKVRTSESDGALGIRPSLTGLPLAIVGQCTSGDFDTPTPETDPDEVQATFGRGRAVELACYAIKNLGLSVILVRGNTSTAADYGTVDDSGMVGSSAITVDGDGSNKPSDDYEVVLKFSTDTGAAGTIGSASPAISYQVSFDAGRNYGPVRPLGTATSLTFTDENVKVDFGAGTIEDGDVWKCAVAAEHMNATDYGTALTALQETQLSWELAALTSPVDASVAGDVKTWLDAMHAAGVHRNAIACYRNQGLYVGETGYSGGAAETDAAYQTAFNTEFSSFDCSSLYVGAGACKVSSAVSRGRRYRRPGAFPVAAMMASVSEEIDVAALDYRLPNVTIRDSKGNRDPGYYDELLNDGALDDMRALTLRTWQGETGVFCNNPRLISAIGSDFDFSPKRRVMNLARGTAVAFLRKFVQSKPLRANKATGKVRESELIALEAAANAKLEKVILAKPKASSVRVVLSRNDDILNPPYPLTGKIRMVPLAYPKDVDFDAGWELSEPITLTVTGGA
jgi:hypothetical protein